SSPVPVDLATGVPITTSVAWAASANATGYDVSFGVTNPPPPVSQNQTGSSYQPASPLAPSTMYYWQVVAKGAGGSTAGPVLSFNTGSSAPTALFLGTDTTTQGNWKGVYGSDGYVLAQDASSLPSYAKLTQLGQLSWMYRRSTAEVRGLLRAAGTGRRE